MEVLWKNWKITMNRYSWDLYRRAYILKDTSRRKKGDEYWRDEGFYTNITTLMNAILRVELEDNKDITGMGGLISEIKEVFESFSNMMDEVRKDVYSS